MTVRGFLNFRTTVDGTVIVFTPSAQNTQTIHNNLNQQITRPPNGIQPTKTFEQPAIQFTNTIDHQPANLQPQSTQNYPTGLVTVLSNRIVNNGLITELETKVYGTYINNKYAQILKSSSRINEPIAFSLPVYLNPTKAFNQIVKPTNINQDFKQYINSRSSLLDLKPKRGENSNNQEDSDKEKGEDADKNSMSNIIKRNRQNRFGNGGRFQYQPRGQAKVMKILNY